MGTPTPIIFETRKPWLLEMIWVALLTLLMGLALCRQLLFPSQTVLRFSPTEAPFNSLMIPEKDHHSLISIMRRIDSAFHGQYFLIGGSLMGSLRYANRMPWDDDIDIGIWNPHLFESYNWSSLGLAIKPVWFGYKIYDPSQTRKTLTEPVFPFVDVFVYQKVGTSYQFVSEKARKTWPREVIPEEILFPLSQCYYADLVLSCPSQASKFLHQAYPKWDERAYLSGSHTGGFLFRSYQMPINEDTTQQVQRYIHRL